MYAGCYTRLMNRQLAASIAVALALLLGIGLFKSYGNIRAEQPSAGETASVLLYYYDTAKDWDPVMGAKCERSSVAPVGRRIAVSDTMILDTLRLLLIGDLKPEEKERGLATEMPLYGVELLNATLDTSGMLTLVFADPEGKLIGGSCRTAILWGQIEATAKQFPGVKEVRFLPESAFQP